MSGGLGERRVVHACSSFERAESSRAVHTGSSINKGIDLVGKRGDMKGYRCARFARDFRFVETTTKR